MKKEKSRIGRMIILVALILAIFVAIQNVSALGIIPGRLIYDFEPGMEEVVEFRVINNEHKDMKVVFYVEGELNNTITLSQKSTYFSPDEKEKTFRYSFKLPEKLEKPGIHEASVIALELPKETTEPGAYVGATVAVATQLYIMVPYPGKYLETDFAIIAGDVGDNTRFIFSAFNFGKENINDASLQIDIMDSNNNLLKTFTSGHKGIQTKKREEFIIDWKTDVDVGTYLARATILYDGASQKIEKWFEIGGTKLELVSITVKDFKLGEIAKLTILVENKWNEELTDIYSRLLIFDSGQTIADLNSPVTGIEAKSFGTMNVYWDTSTVREGDYKGKILLYHKGQPIERELKLKVGKDYIDVEIVGITAEVIARRGERASLNFIWIFLIALLAIANLAWFLYFKNKGGKKGKGGSHK